ncbi:phospholipase D-like domain-containing protein [Ramlibacter albus]|uniref:Phospholipase D family protein n=1 Tax=Ramlibacter albus TaxID=2079448 RepID=A0A923M5Q2_9BURK|nr:phospholipase D family protein [Ramlibacter albus]MBC5763393.1 phospholipase D family protein [Ramlibacter albus]
MYSAAFRWIFLAFCLSWATGCASLPANASRPASRAFEAPEQTALGQLAIARRGNARSDSGFHLLDSVDIALTSRLALVERAQRTLDLQYYAIHADASTEVLLQRIRKAAQRGVRVRILLDDFNSVGEDAQVLRMAFEPNIELRLFNPLPGSRGSMLTRLVGSLHDVERVQKRMHNKLFIADNAWGIAGGRNLGDRYFGGGDKQNFVDLDVLAAGRIVRDMSTSFDRYWNDELAYPVESLLSKEDLDRLRKPESPLQPVAATGSTVLPGVTPAEAAQTDRPAMDLARVELAWAPAILLADQPGKIGPGDDEVNAGETVVDGLLTLMSQARRDVLIVSPYFVPGTRMLAVFEQLRKRNVRIRVLTNSLASNDAPAAHAGYARYRDRLLGLGLEIHEMRAAPETAAGLGSGTGSATRSIAGSGPGGSKSGTSRASLHSKAVIIDGYLSIIGSMNLDLRSQLKNSEVALLIRGPAIAQQAIRQVEATIATDAYRLEKGALGYVWRAPPGAPFKDSHGEPEASVKQKLLVNLIGPFAPDEML